MTLAADIVAKQSSGGDCASQSGARFVDGGYSLDGDVSCSLGSGPGSRSGSSACGSSTCGEVLGSYLAGSLAENGGPTATIALLNNPDPHTTEPNPALAVVPEDFHLPVAVNGETAACLVPDQRGRMPAAGIKCNIGAYHLQATKATVNASDTSVGTHEEVAFTATVFPLPLAGTVSFHDGDGNPATTQCADRKVEYGTAKYGTATCTVSYPAAGSFSVTAYYSGDGDSNNYAPSSAPAPVSLKVIEAGNGNGGGEGPGGNGEGAGGSGNGGGSGAPPVRRGYCSVAGNTSPATGAPLPPGTFLNLEAGQPASDPHYTGAVPANFLEGIGTSCGVPHGFKPTGLTVGNGGPGSPGFYPFYAKTEPPAPPTGLTGGFTAGYLLLSWQPAGGNVIGYEVAFNNKTLKTLPGITSVKVRTFVPGESTVYTVRAIDAAGNKSAPSNTVHVFPSPRPTTAPTHIPSWAWELLAWQQRGSHGPRPAAAPNPPPAWYADWTAWRKAPFAVTP